MYKAVRVRFYVDGTDCLTIELRKMNNRLAYVETLTIGQDFDILLIRVLDKIFRRNRIERLSLKTVEIGGKMAPGALSGMILRSVW